MDLMVIYIGIDADMYIRCPDRYPNVDYNCILNGPFSLVDLFSTNNKVLIQASSTTAVPTSSSNWTYLPTSSPTTAIPTTKEMISSITHKQQTSSVQPSFVLQQVFDTYCNEYGVPPRQPKKKI
eukprot:458773_1